MREVTREVLKHAGYIVLESGSAKEALHLAAEEEKRDRGRERGFAME